jgi:deoxyribonuclease-4
MKNLIGSHVAGGKNLARALTAVDLYGLEAIQVFIASPKQYNFPPGDPALDEEFRKAAHRRNLRVFVHSSYLINLASENNKTRYGGQGMLRKTLQRAKAIGAEGVVFHAGSSGENKEEGYKRLKKILLPLLEESQEKGYPPLLLEPMTSPKSLSSTIESIAPYLKAVEDHPHLKVCFDSAHMLAAGEPLDSIEGCRESFEKFETLVGLDRLGLIHANDSKTPRGSKQDRHENLGEGHVGNALWPYIFNAPELTVPLILETPGKGFSNDLEILRAARRNFIE